MRRFQIVCAVAVIVAGGIFISCQKKSSEPAGPTGPTGPQRNVFLSDGFEYSSDSLANKYNKVAWVGGRGFMSTTTDTAHSGTHSLTSDSSKTGIKLGGAFSIQDSIAGLEFYLMAKKAEQINFFSALASSGSAWNGLYIILGMGISRSDSLQYIYQYDPSKPDSNYTKCFASLQFNKWYKCNIEYSFPDTTVTYSLDDSVVYTRKTPLLSPLNVFLVARDSVVSEGAGSQGSKEYYIDDVTVYER